MMERAIVVDVAHVRGLVAYGSGWALMYDGVSPVIVSTDHGDDGTLLEIITYEGLRHMRERLAAEGEPHDDDRIADDLTDISRDDHADWDARKALMPLTVPYTHALAAHGFRRWLQGEPDAEHRIRQAYHTGYDDGGEYLLTFNATPGAPVIIERICRRPDGAYIATMHVATVPADTPPTDVAALIAARHTAPAAAH